MIIDIYFLFFAIRPLLIALSSTYCLIAFAMCLLWREKLINIFQISKYVWWIYSATTHSWVHSYLVGQFIVFSPAIHTGRSVSFIFYTTVYRLMGLHCTVFYFTACSDLHYIRLYYAILSFTVQYYLCFTVLYCIVLYCTVIYCILVYCTVL